MKTFEINKKNLTRLSKNIKKKLEKENINIKHNQLLNILASSFGYHDFNHFNNTLNSLEILNINHQSSFHNSKKIIEKIKNGKEDADVVKDIFLEVELAKTICVDISLAYELELMFPNEYFLDIKSIIDEIVLIYESKEVFFERRIFKEVLPYMHSYFGNNETGFLFLSKLLNEIPNEYIRKLFIETLNDWSLFYVSTHFKDDLKYQKMLKC